MTMRLHARRNLVSILRRMVFIVGLLALGASLGLALGSGLFAADLVVVPGHSLSKPHAPPKDTSRIERGTPLEEFATGANASCTAWTDGCRTCGRVLMAAWPVRISGLRVSRRSRVARATSIGNVRDWQ